MSEDTRPAGDLSTVAEPPPWLLGTRERPTWGLGEGDTLAPGRTILRSLGGGKRYEVFLVWDDHRLAVLVAKVLRPDHAAEPAGLQELRREARALARLSHPVVVRGFDAVVDTSPPHLLIEHLEGPTLTETLERDGALALEQLLPLGLHLASALHYMAAEGMVHLDVKPDNVVMGAPPRLIDFSVARTVEDAARTRTPIGTDGYMAPEQAVTIEGRSLGPPADVFGLGATLHHALGGRRPFPRVPGDPERFPQLTRRPEPLPRRTPRALVELVMSMLAVDPAARPIAAEVAARLEPLVAALPRRLALGRR